MQFSHQNYGVFDALKSNGEVKIITMASKPYSYDEVAKYYDFETANQSLQKKSILVGKTMERKFSGDSRKIIGSSKSNFRF